MLPLKARSCSNQVLVSARPRVAVMQGQQKRSSLWPHQSRLNHGAPSYSNAIGEVPVWHRVGNEPARTDVAATKTLTIGSSNYFSHKPQQTTLIQPSQNARGYRNECVGSG